MAENYKEGDLPDLMGASEGGSESASEQFRENLKKGQMAAKQVKQQEQKAKQYDNTLAQLVTFLLQDKTSDHLIVLIAILIEHNIPSDFLLAVLSLQFEIAFDYANKNVRNLNSTELMSLNKHLQINLDQVDFLSADMQIKLQEWAELIINNAFKDAEKVFETVIQIDTWEINISLIHLAAHLIQDFVNTNETIIDFEQAKEFSYHFFSKLLEDLQNFVIKS